MKPIRIAGFALLALVWLWLCRALLMTGGGVTFKNLFLIVASGIIIFVPLYKKYWKADSKEK